MPEVLTEKYPLAPRGSLHRQPWMEHVAWIAAIRSSGHDMLHSYMSNNIPGDLSFEETEIVIPRSYSAYFSVQFENPGPHVLIEAGLIQTDGKAKLHDFLDQYIDFRERQEQGYYIVSGHFGRGVEITQGNTTIMGNLALLDQISSENELNEAQQILTSSLRWMNILPVTADGHPILD